MSKLLYSFCSDGEINMVMEYMDGGSLDLVMKKRGKIEEQYSRKITYAVSALILFVHNWLKPLSIIFSLSSWYKVSFLLMIGFTWTELSTRKA